MRTATLILLCVFATLAASCGKPAQPPGMDPLRVAATLPPLEWVARGLAPQGAVVSTLLPPGASEHGYEPPPSRLADFSRAEVALMVGLGLEPAADRALRASPRGGRAVIVFADELPEPVGSHTGHDHAEGEDHPPHPTDPHLWLDPSLMRRYVGAVHAAIERRLRRDGAAEAVIRDLAAGRDAMLAEIDAVDREYRERLAPYQGAAIVAAHDSVRRLADRYGLRVVGVLHTHTGAEPTPDAIMRAAAALREAEHRAILVEPQSSRALGERLSSETGAPIAEFDSLGSGDWPAMMRANLDALTAALAQTRPNDSR